MHSTTFNKDLTQDDMTNAAFYLHYCKGNAKDMKKDLQAMYKEETKSITNANKIVRELIAMFVADETEPIKQAILNEIDLSVDHFYVYLPREVYQTLFWLTFPIFAELQKLISSYEDNCFTPNAILESLEMDFAKQTTKKTSVYRALKTLEEFGVIKKVRHGIFKLNKTRIVDPQAIACLLMADSVLGNGTPNPASPFLCHVAFEISHEFMNCYDGIDYSKIIPADVLEEFKHVGPEFTIQYNKRAWKICDEPISKDDSLDDFMEKIFVTVANIESAKAKRKKWEKSKQ